MSNERIPIVAMHLAGNVAPYVADVFSRVRENSSDGIATLIERAFEKAKDDLNVDLVRSIMGPLDNEWTRESLVSVVGLCNEAIYTAMKNRSLLDRRRSPRTRRELLRSLADDHIRRWMTDRGIDPGEAYWLRDEGGAK